MILYNSPDWIGCLLGPMFQDKETINFFFNSIKSTIDYRKKNNVRRNDFIDLITDIKEQPHALGENGKNVNSLFNVCK